MKLPEKLRVPVLWGHTRDNVKVVYENIPEVRAAETINQLIDYQKEYEERVEIITNDLLERVGGLEGVEKHKPYCRHTGTSLYSPQCICLSKKEESELKDTITIKKPEWWDKRFLQDQVVYQEALTACSEASGVKFTLED